MTSAGIEPATFRFVAQHLNYCATAVPRLYEVEKLILLEVRHLTLAEYKRVVQMVLS